MRTKSYSLSEYSTNFHSTILHIKISVGAQGPCLCKIGLIHAKQPLHLYIMKTNT
jgi:hypothetical protein